MPNPFFSAMFGGMPQGNANGMQGFGSLSEFMNMVQELKKNPIQFVMQKKLNVTIPQEIANDPEAMLQYLLQTGQRSQNQVNAAYQQSSKWGITNYGR